MSVASEFDLCSLPPVIFGTGNLYILESAIEQDMGNFSVVDFSVEGETTRFFDGNNEVVSALGATELVRLELSGDSYSIRNLSRLFNEGIVQSGTADRLPLQTVKALPMRQFRFTKDVSAVCGISECFLNLILWRAYINLPFTYSFNQDEPSIHVFNIIGVPDAITHPSNPFGYLEFTCPVLPRS